MNQLKKNTAYYHLPGLFEFYELYRVFLPLFREHREYFYDWCEIGSVYGAPSDCIWGGGRTSFGDHDPQEIPGFYFVSSTTKVLTDFEQFVREVNREEFLYVVPDFRLNKVFDKLSTLTGAQKDKVEFLCNECCWFGCGDRKICYEAVSRKNLGENGSDHRCAAPDAGNGYRKSRVYWSG